MKHTVNQSCCLVASLALIFGSGFGARGQIADPKSSTSGVTSAPGNSAEMMVVDAKGKNVGQLVGPNTVLRKVNGTWIAIPVSTQGFQDYGYYFYYFTSANCTGIKYVYNGGGLPAYGYVHIDALPSLKVHLIYSGTPTFVTVNSTQYFDQNVPQPCSPATGTQLAGPAQTVDITDKFGLTPPFRLR